MNLKYILLSLLLYIPLYGQISPGDLTVYHAHLEGLSSCTKCHEMGEKLTNKKCLDCHKEIQELQANSHGWHSSPDVKSKNCWSCHSEHNGRNFRIINFNKDKFDHSKTGFSLTGQHQKKDCSACHNKDNVKRPNLKNRQKTYLGLEAKCSSCHKDYHQGTIKSDCSNCHNTEKFRPAVGFNHDKSSFKLTGAHTKTECVKCHAKEKKNGQDYQRFKGVQFASCLNCHKDVHAGKLGNECKTCHTTTSFNDINKSLFNHDKTNYPLLGKHKIVQCQSCHKNDLNSKPKHDNCSDCHTDYHKGEFTNTNNKRDCKSCHTVNGFSPSEYTIEEHNKGKFPLTGSHPAIPCKNCHYKENAYSFRFSGTRCLDCHKNIHDKELSTKFLPDSDCTYCHSTVSWSVIKFEHSLTSFPLLGKHQQQTCRKCHQKENTLLFSSIKNDCSYCHTDIHNGQFTTAKVTGCQECHTFSDWKPERFDHNKSRFSLEGAHKNLRCSSCHKQTQKNNVQFINYKMEDFRCAACHH